jgi:hypothetical protein
MDFGYHIRGMQNCINCSNNTTTLNGGENDLFSHKLDFETEGFYDGNIGKQSWQGVNDQNQAIGLRSYTYGHDKSSRLLSGIYAGINGENFSLSNISYDKNGNILNLQRKGNNGGSFGDIDNLTYNYSGNKLNYVNDAINGNEEIGDFRNNNTGTNDYEYWNDGSLKVDRNKGILLIEYDSYLKKTKKISFSTGWVEFFYNGDGTLIKRTNSLGDVWDYVGNMIFKNGIPYQMSISEGRAVYIAGVWVYEYEYRDHQNNLRVAFKAEGNQLLQTQTNETDPFGLSIQPLSLVGVSPQNFRFQNQEKIEDFGLNLNWFKYRPFDPQTGRGWQIDRLADEYVHNSPYAFSENKVTNHIELDGLEAVPVNNSSVMLKSLEPIPYKPVKIDNEPVIDGTLKITCCAVGGNIKLAGFEMSAYRGDDEISVIGFHENDWSFAGKEGGVYKERGILKAGVGPVGVNFEQERSDGKRTNKYSANVGAANFEVSNDDKNTVKTDSKLELVGVKASFIVGFEFGVNVHLQRLLTGSKVSSNPRVIKKDETNIPQSRILIKNK